MASTLIFKLKLGTPKPQHSKSNFKRLYLRDKFFSSICCSFFHILPRGLGDSSKKSGYFMVRMTVRGGGAKPKTFRVATFYAQKLSG